MEPTRLALVGLGRIACDQHLPAIAATPEIELVAMASRISRLDGVECFATVEELLAEVADVDAFALCEMAAGLVTDALMMAIWRRESRMPCCPAPFEPSATSARSTAVLVALSIYLRFRGSLESKPVSARNCDTGPRD